VFNRFLLPGFRQVNEQARHCWSAKSRQRATKWTDSEDHGIVRYGIAAKRRAQALRKVEAGRLVVRLQQQIVHELKANGRDSKEAESLLRDFEQSQDILERELAAFS
jgi:hypothetical protein